MSNDIIDQINNIGPWNRFAIKFICTIIFSGHIWVSFQDIEVLLKELNELRSRVKNLEEMSQQRAQQQALEIPSIQIPIRLDITTNDQDTSQNIGVGKATKKIRITKRKCYKPPRQPTNSPFQGYHFRRKNATKLLLNKH